MKTDILFQVTLKEEEMERAEKIEKYVLEETNKWDLIDDKKLVLLRCQFFWNMLMNQKDTISNTEE